MAEPLVKVKDLKKHFPIRGGVFGGIVAWVKAVDDISFDIYKGETLGLVGESGSGKTTAGKTILQLYKPTAGEVYFEGRLINNIKGEDLRKLRRNMQIIFQDPYGSLNPRMPISEIIGEPLLVHGLVKSKKEMLNRVVEVMELVGLRPEYLNRYPHEFSGGQRQRIGIARAIVLNPKFVVCDEPVSALDVSIQSQVINLLNDLQEKLKLTYLFIAHDLAVIRHMCDRVVVMYLGNVMEIAENQELFENPLHPYTQALLSAVPVPDPEVKKERIILKGDIPSPINPPSGCVFHTRCPIAMPICKEVKPELREVKPGHFVACHAVK
ncbi:MAG: peptide ABC transporter substrate-binding protein [Caldiserica bacterium]|nr:MAG: peptide ABC transporter substrate-binding protein [Caldisericota bacterium]